MFERESKQTHLHYLTLLNNGRVCGSCISILIFFFNVLLPLACGHFQCGFIGSFWCFYSCCTNVQVKPMK